MVYITGTTLSDVIFPKVVTASASTLSLVNQNTKSVSSYTITDKSQTSNVYTIDLSLGSIDNGQYSYVITDASSNRLMCGILQIGEYIPDDVSTYTPTLENLKQYSR